MRTFGAVWCAARPWPNRAPTVTRLMFAPRHKWTRVREQALAGGLCLRGVDEPVVSDAVPRVVFPQIPDCRRLYPLIAGSVCSAVAVSSLQLGPRRPAGDVERGQATVRWYVMSIEKSKSVNEPPNCSV